MRPIPIRSPAAILTALVLMVAGIALGQSDSRPSAPRQPAAAQSAKVIALSFYADWCPGCKALKPKLEDLMQSASTQPCLFVRLDQTDKQSRQAEYMLAALRLGDLWKTNAGKTGFVLLVDAKSGKVVSTLTADQDADAMRAALASAIGG